MVNEKNNFDEFADAGEENVAALLGTLKRVDAPGDFDFKVRARIAKGRPASSRTSWFPALARVAAPAMMLAAVGGYFGYNALYTSESSVPVIAEVTPTIVAPVAAAEPRSDEVVPSPVATIEVAIAKPTTEPITEATARKDRTDATTKREVPQGGSVDSALRETNSISTRPSNVENTGNSSPIVPTSTLSVREVFSAMGIRASFSGGWRVSSASGRAAAAGLKAGDIIESVNGKAVGQNTVFDANFSGSTLRVKRDGATIQVSL